MNDDEMTQRSARNMGTMWMHAAQSSGGRTEEWDDAIAADSGAPNPVPNRTTVTSRDPDAESLLKRVRTFYDGASSPWGIVDAWNTLPLGEHGFRVLATMPLMVRPPGDAPFEQPGDLTIARVATDEGMADFKRALFEGFTLVPWPTEDAPLFGRSFFENESRKVWVGYIDGEPIACSVSFRSDGIVGVYLVAVAERARGRRIGEALSWAATSAEPDLPAVLQASSMGFPVYERMGYRVIGDCIFWVPA